MMTTTTTTTMVHPPKFKVDQLSMMSEKPLVDPLAYEERQLRDNLRQGLSKLLDMHNPAEIGSLCGAVGLVRECEFGTVSEKKAGLLRFIEGESRKVGSSAQRAYLEALNMMWEGILFEYLRAEGQPVRSARAEPRAVILALWRQRAAAAMGGSAAFRPTYVPRHVRTRAVNNPARAPDLEGLLRAVEAKELGVKHLEGKIRKEADYRHVLNFLASTTSLHEFERDARDYLMHELEAARARIDHYCTSLDIAASQLEELEGRHEAVATALTTALAQAQSHLDFALDMGASEDASEYMHLDHLLRSHLTTQGPADGSMRLDETGEHHTEEGEEAPPPGEGLPLEASFPTHEARAMLAEEVGRAVTARLPGPQVSSATLCALAMEKHAADLAAVLRRALAAEATFHAAHDRLDSYRAVGAVEAARGDILQRFKTRASLLDGRLVAAFAADAAKHATEAAFYSRAASNAIAEKTNLERCIRNVAPILHALITATPKEASPTSDTGCYQPAGAAIAVSLAVSLEAFGSRAAAFQLAERAAMGREELLARTHEALRGAPPKMASKKGKSKKQKVPAPASDKNKDPRSKKKMDSPAKKKTTPPAAAATAAGEKKTRRS